MLVGEDIESHASLPKLADALNALRLEAGLAQCGEKERSQNRDDGNDAEQFEERKCPGQVLAALVGRSLSSAFP